MPKPKKRSVAYALLLLFLAYLAFYISRHYKDFRPLLDVSLVFLLLVAAGHLTSIYLNALFMKYIMEPFGKIITSTQAFMVSLVSTVGNYFLPVGTGAGIRAVYLKKRHGLSYTDFMSTLSGNYIIVFLINSFVGLLALGMLRSYAPAGQLIVVGGVLAGIFLSMVVLATVGFPGWLIRALSNAKFLGRYMSILSNSLDGWNTITRNRKLLWRLIVLTLLQLAGSVFIIYVAVVALGYEVKIWALLLYASLTSLSLLLNVTPGSIGIRESIFVLMGATLGLTTPQILSIAIIEKGTLFFVLIVSWLLLQTGIINKKLDLE